jgi:hypothetical protein
MLRPLGLPIKDHIRIFKLHGSYAFVWQTSSMYSPLKWNYFHWTLNGSVIYSRGFTFPPLGTILGTDWNSVLCVISSNDFYLVDELSLLTCPSTFCICNKKKRKYHLNDTGLVIAAPAVCEYTPVQVQCTPKSILLMHQSSSYDPKSRTGILFQLSLCGLFDMISVKGMPQCVYWISALLLSFLLLWIGHC